MSGFLFSFWNLLDNSKLTCACWREKSVYSLPQRSSVSGSEAYLSRSMAPEAPSMIVPDLLLKPFSFTVISASDFVCEIAGWSWQGRQSNPHHFQSSSMGYDQSYHPSQSLQQEGYPFNYNVPQGSPRGYYQSGGLPSSYLSVPPAGPSQPRRFVVTCLSVWFQGLGVC